MAGVLGFEPRNAGARNQCLTAWPYPIIPAAIREDIGEIHGCGMVGVLDRNRTCDLSLRRRPLYPTELQTPVVLTLVYYILSAAKGQEFFAKIL